MSIICQQSYQWRLLRGGRFIIMSGTERMERHQTPGNHVFDVFHTIPLIQIQSLPPTCPPQLRCHQPPVVWTHSSKTCPLCRPVVDELGGSACVSGWALSGWTEEQQQQLFFKLLSLSFFSSNQRWGVWSSSNVLIQSNVSVMFCFHFNLKCKSWGSLVVNMCEVQGLYPQGVRVGVLPWDLFCLLDHN